MTAYRSLEAWKKAMEIVRVIYLLTKDFPREELYGLTQQARRAAVSVPANIAEGIGRNYKKDTLQFLHISRGSLYELETLVEISFMIDLIKHDQLIQIGEMIDEERRILNGLIKSYEGRPELK